MRVELVRVVEHGRFCGTGCRSVVVTGDGMEELRQRGRIEILRAFLDHPQSEMDVAEEPALVGLSERRAASQLAYPADVMEQSRGEQQIRAQPRMELSGLAAERRDADRMLEQPTCVAVMLVGACCGECSKGAADLKIANESIDYGGKSGMRDLRCEELEEAVELVGISPQRRGERRRVGILGWLDRAHLHLQPSTEALDAPEHVHGVPLFEATLEQIDVAPHSGLDPPTRIGKLEGEVRRPGTRPAPLLLRDREDTLDGAILGELGDRGHVPSLDG